MGGAFIHIIVSVSEEIDAFPLFLVKLGLLVRITEETAVMSTGESATATTAPCHDVVVDNN